MQNKKLIAWIILFSTLYLFATAPKTITVQITSVVRNTDALELEFQVKNVSDQDVWVCVSDYFPEVSSKGETPVRRSIEQDGGWLKLSFTSMVFDGYDLKAGDRFVWTKYQKLKKGETLKRKLILKNPITEDNDDKYSFGKPSNQTILSKDIQTVYLIQGYFTNSLDSNSKCCNQKVLLSTKECELTVDCAREYGEQTRTTRTRYFK